MLSLSHVAWSPPRPSLQRSLLGVHLQSTCSFVSVCLTGVTSQQCG